MSANYTWYIDKISAKKEFTDKNGNKRNNVIKSVELAFKGEREGGNPFIKKTVVNFDLIDLSLFEDIESVTNQMVLDWALSKINPKQKEAIEKSVRVMLGEEEVNEIKVELNG